jgi:hypothetical protein
MEVVFGTREQRKKGLDAGEIDPPIVQTFMSILNKQGVLLLWWIIADKSLTKLSIPI